MIPSVSINTFLALGTGAIVGIAIGVVVLILIIWVISMYNGLVRTRQSCRESWADIDTELNRRHDLIPNLVNCVKGYAKHEADVMNAVTDLRGKAMGAKDASAADRSHVEGALEQGVGKLMMVAENYPDLKASTNFLELQKELSETETRIARARRFYNSNVRSLHNSCEMFPSSIIAGMGGFKSDEYSFFQADDGSRAPVAVDFGAGTS
ncbi:MAG: LemA family protein [Phycisphaerales bacterium]|nr:LemA family protein [Phycisphaerales bacterium]